MVDGVSQNLLTGIANPAIADISGARSRGRARGQAITDRRQAGEIKRLSGEILSNTFPGKLGELGRLAPEKAIGLANALGFNSDPLVKMKHFVGSIQAANTMAQTVGPVEATQFLLEARDRQAMLDRASGVEPETSPFDSILEGAQQDPEQLKEALSLMTDALIEQGAIADPKATKSVAENRKEIRASVRKQVSSIRKEEGILTTNFKKIRELGDEIDKSNRSAVSQALVALVKLGDPTSVVRPSEAAAALNNPSILAALFTDAGTDQSIVDAAIRAIDPLNPGVLRKGDIIATADALVLASVPSIQSRFGDAKTEGENLLKSTFKTIFSGRLEKRVNALSDLVKREPAKINLTPDEQTRLEELRAKAAQ